MTNLHYPNTQSEIDFAKLEKKILKFWEDDNTFQKSVEKNTKAEFVFYDGPPFANGLPHYGHLLTGFAKDAIARYQTMLGKRVERKFGWDCHGLPAEMAAEKELGIGGRAQIQNFGIEKFNDVCRTSVMQFSSKWEEYVSRQGRWVDFRNSYKTMDKPFMESVIWAFSELYKKGLVYESVKVVPYSFACQTPLSNFETRLDNAYRQKASKAVTVAFELLDEIFGDGKKCYLVAWTTTPWTLPSNLLLAVNTELKYKAIEKDNAYYIAGEFFYKDENGRSVEIEKILNAGYKPLFPYFENEKKSFFIVNANFVKDGEGTGVVHVAPGFGEDDFEIAKAHGTQVVCPVDASGRFTDQVTDFVGQHVFDTNDEIIKILKEKRLWIKTEQYLHNYPHCWRTDTPLIYKAVPSWYVKVSAFKDKMVQLNQQINWVPSHIKDGLFGNWLENAKDWAISRNRFWGTPIPVWKSTDQGYPRVDVYGSQEELKKDFGIEITDFHRPFIDELRRENPDDPTGQSEMVRVEDVFDCWFESGSMPFAQAHYPFENKSWFENNFPSDFITEYVAQTRGWFYTLMVLSTALFERPPFKNCVCHGVILDSTGQKLSKRLNNYTDPLEIFDKYGSDALRFLMLSSNAMSGGNLLIDKEGKMVKDVLRLVTKPIWNTYNFFTTYANFHSIKAEQSKSDGKNVMDSYILSKSSQAILNIKNNLDMYDMSLACKVIPDFFDILNNWYIRRTRWRFVDGDQSAFNTLYTVFIDILCAVSPLLPFICEEIWLGLGGKKSVHLQDFPSVENIDSDLVSTMDKIREICNAALSIRNKTNIRIRQPLKSLSIKTDQKISSEFLDLIKDEVNVKEVNLSDDFNVDLSIKLNFQVIGKRYPDRVKEMTKAAKSGQWERRNDNIFVGEFLMRSDEYDLIIASGREDAAVLQNGKTIVVLDTNVDSELELEGYARDIVRFVQQARKDAGLKIQDNAVIKIDTTINSYVDSAKRWKNYILESTYASDIILSNNFSDCMFEKEVLQGVKIGIRRLDTNE